MKEIYSRDAEGRPSLVGLTFEETVEFLILDAEPPVDENGKVLRWEADEASFPNNQKRWLELYQKHRTACRG
jgi:hypothetical protein